VCSSGSKASVSSSVAPQGARPLVQRGEQGPAHAVPRCPSRDRHAQAQAMRCGGHGRVGQVPLAHERAVVLGDQPKVTMLRRAVRLGVQQLLCGEQPAGRVGVGQRGDGRGFLGQAGRAQDHARIVRARA
jgi:hypothetical protein